MKLVRNGEVWEIVVGTPIWIIKGDMKKIILYKNYTPEEYPKYENFDAIKCKSK